jgi:hypothetical protein
MAVKTTTIHHLCCGGAAPPPPRWSVNLAFLLTLVVLLLYLVDQREVVLMKLMTPPEVLSKSSSSSSDITPPVLPNNVSLSCVWEPNNDQDCLELLSQRIYGNNNNSKSRRPWLFFGDSTSFRLFGNSALRRTIVNAPSSAGSSCHFKSAGRCNTDSLFGMSRASEWIPPNVSRGEGPEANGLINHFCQDCDGCGTELLVCDGGGGYSGGYGSVEFARDVELQSTEFQTTQENWAHYLHRAFNSNNNDTTPKPVCVFQAGIHDAAVPNISTAVYLQNVEWYLALFALQCSHLVWLGNGRPKTDDFLQKQKQTFIWNHAIQQDILQAKFPMQSSYIDVYNASINYPMLDNLHMDYSWYSALGGMFVSIMNKAGADSDN